MQRKEKDNRPLRRLVVYSLSTTSMWCFFFSQIPGKETRLPVVGKEDT